MTKIYLLISLIFSYLFSQAQNQTKEKSSINNFSYTATDKRLRVCLNFEDTIPIYCNTIDSSKSVIYKFKLSELYMGEYSKKEILVEIDKRIFLHERQRWGGNQKTFFWVLIKTDIIMNEMPLYKKTGNF
jgi:hypothetical protein